MTVDNRVIKVVAKELMLSVAEVTPATRMAEDLRMDSLDCLELIMAIEEEFEVEIEDETAEGFKTVQDIIDHVQRQVSGVVQ